MESDGSLEWMLWLLIMFAGWLAATVSGAAGFGGALLLLPVITYAVGAKAAVPILTVAQLLGNLSRAGFGGKEIQWWPVLLFSLGAVPVSVLGAQLFVALPAPLLTRGIGILLLGLVAFRHTHWGKRPVPALLLAPAGAVVGLLSALTRSVGSLGAAVLLSLGLPPTAYVASEAVTASLMHLTKTVVYGRYALLSGQAWLVGLALGGAMVLGSWSGRQLIQKLPERTFGRVVEVLLVVSALTLIIR
jgi:uncharacterized membrane protein YfcA